MTPERTQTSNVRVLVHALEPAPLIMRLKKSHADLEFEGCDTYPDLSSQIRSFGPDIVFSIRFAGTAGFPRDALFATHGPRWISVGGSGVDHLVSWDVNRVQVTNAAGVAADMMAEYVLGGFLHFSLGVRDLEQDRHDQIWRGDREMIPLKGKTLLIIGLGHTGRAIAARAKAFGMNVIGTRTHPQKTQNVDEVFSSEDISDLWRRADYLAVCVPLTAKTKSLIDEVALNAIKPGAIIADVSRGSIVKESALLEALRSGRLGGAVLDVFASEPLPHDHDLWIQPNVLLSPHCSSVYSGWEFASIDMFSDNINRWRNNQPLNNLVFPPQ